MISIFNKRWRRLDDRELCSLEEAHFRLIFRSRSRAVGERLGLAQFRAERTRCVPLRTIYNKPERGWVNAGEAQAGQVAHVTKVYVEKISLD